MLHGRFSALFICELYTVWYCLPFFPWWFGFAAVHCMYILFSVLCPLYYLFIEMINTLHLVVPSNFEHFASHVEFELI